MNIWKVYVYYSTCLNAIWKWRWRWLTSQAPCHAHGGPRKFQSHLNSFDVKGLLSLECGIHGLTGQPSIIPYPGAGIAVLKVKTLHKNLFAIYYITWADKKMEYDRDGKMYVDSILAVAPRGFQTWATLFH